MSDDIPFIHCSLRLSRNYKLFLYRIFATMFIIVLCTTSVFRFPAENLNDRISFVGTSLLTVVDFSLSSSNRFHSYRT